MNSAIIIKTIGLFVLTAIAEIVGCYLPYLWFRRDQTPWLKRLPSEYFRDHIRIGSQPMHEPEKPEQMHQMLDMLHADETLIYCSDFPHFDWNDPVTVLPKLSEHLHQRIFVDNAFEMLRL